MERALVEYIANALWQIPLLAAGAWLLLRAMKPSSLTQHCVWLAVLAMSVLLPIRGIGKSVPSVIPDSHTEVCTRVAGSELPATLTASAVAVGEGTMRSRLRWPIHVHNIRLNALVAHFLIALYVAIALFGIARFALGWNGARRLVARAVPVTLLAANNDELHRCCLRLDVKKPEVRESSEITSPMIAGVSSPVLLVPAGFEDYSPEEIRAALYHELAHLRRHDYVVNLLCEAVAVPVAWHPATQAVQQRIRRTREMVCDAIAAREMCSEIGYARCLMTLAKSMLREQVFATESHAIGFFSSNTLEERVMQLMDRKEVQSLRAKLARLAGGASCMLTTVVVASIIHVTPTLAAQHNDDLPQQANAAHAGSAVPSQSATVVAQAEKKQKPSAAHANTDITNSSVESGNTTLDSAVSQYAAMQSEVSAAESLSKCDEVRRQAEEIKRMLNSPEFKKQIEDARKQTSDAEMIKVRQQMAELQARLQSGEFQKQIEDAKRQAAEITRNNAEFQRQMEDFRKKMQNGEFRQQMEKAAQALKDAERELRENHIQ